MSASCRRSAALRDGFNLTGKSGEGVFGAALTLRPDREIFASPISQL